MMQRDEHTSPRDTRPSGGDAPRQGQEWADQQEAPKGPIPIESGEATDAPTRRGAPKANENPSKGQGTPLKVILSGGGTGGHIFPAVAIADRIKALVPDADIRFVGAQGRMEMERVPKAGYPIEGLWISGIQRSWNVQNLLFPLKLVSSLWNARRIIRRVRPHVVVGTGGYASGPLLRQAAAAKVPTLIQEQNAYAGLTNKWLAPLADRICVAYPGMEKYFPAAKLLEAGNPVREDMLANAADRSAGCAHYGFDAARPVVLLTGGSLGAKTLNAAMDAAEATIAGATDVQWLWQCGNLYEAEYRESAVAKLPNVRLVAFLDRMDLAYAAADVVISRAGALTIAEICLLGKAAVLVPSPNVAEDHQSKNAQALADRHAAWIVKDTDAANTLIMNTLQLLNSATACAELRQNARKMAYPGAADKIAREVLALAKWPINKK